MTNTLKIHDQPRLLSELLEGITQAEGACSQLIHAMQDPRFMVMRHALELTKEGIIEVATFNARLTSARPN